MESFLISDKIGKVKPPMCGNPRPFKPSETKESNYLHISKTIIDTLVSNQGIYVETTDLEDIVSKIVLDISPHYLVRVCLATSSLCLGLWDYVRKQNRSLQAGYAVENVINYSDDDNVVFVTANYLQIQKGNYTIIDERVIYENTLLPPDSKYIIITKSKITPLPYPSIDLIERHHNVSRYYIPSSSPNTIASIIEREKGFKGVLFCDQPDMFVLKNLFPSIYICSTDEVVNPETDFIIDLFPSSKGESLYRVNSLGSRKEGRVYTLMSVEDYKNLDSYSIRTRPSPFRKLLSSKVLEDDVRNYYYLRVSLAIDCMLFAFQSNPFKTDKSEKFFGITMIHTYTNLFLYLINDLTRMAKQDKETKARTFTLDTERLIDDTIVTDMKTVYSLDQKTGLVSINNREVREKKHQFTNSTEWYVHSWCEDNKVKEDEILLFLKIFNSQEILLIQENEWYRAIQGWNPLLDFELYDDVSTYLVDIARSVLPSTYTLTQRDLLSYGQSALTSVLLITDENKPSFSCVGTESTKLRVFPSLSLCTFMVPNEDIDNLVLVKPELVRSSTLENIQLVIEPIDISKYPVTMFPSTLFISPTDNIIDYIKTSPIPLYMDKGLEYVVDNTSTRSFSKQERGRIICYIRFLNSYRNIKGLKVLLVGISSSISSYLAILYPSITFHLYEQEENPHPANLTFHTLPFQKDYDLVLSGLKTGSSEHFHDQNQKDMEYQYDIVDKVNPSIGSLIRLVPEKGRDFQTYSGKILIVPWAERSSRETFLQTEAGAKMITYKGSYYDNYLRFISLVRKEGNYQTDIVGGKCSDSCYDCTSEKMALSSVVGSKDVSMEMDKISSLIFDDLCLEKHN